MLNMNEVMKYKNQNKDSTLKLHGNFTTRQEHGNLNELNTCIVVD